jgi:predicted Kef-type K+ transport protein
MTGPQLSVAFFLQMFVILAVCRIVGALARRLGQPQVVGEMIAGVLLGPSLFAFSSPVCISMMVLMAIVTTLMASPAFELVYSRHARQKGERGATPTEG